MNEGIANDDQTRRLYNPLYLIVLLRALSIRFGALTSDWVSLSMPPSLERALWQALYQLMDTGCPGLEEKPTMFL